MEGKFAYKKEKEKLFEIYLTKEPVTVHPFNFKKFLGWIGIALFTAFEMFVFLAMVLVFLVWLKANAFNYITILCSIIGIALIAADLFGLNPIRWYAKIVGIKKELID